jgi:hypothetical protein
MQKKELKNLDYLDKGIAISPASPTVGDKITILYDGVLSKKGSPEITLHLGYGSNWDSEQEVPMIRSDTCYEATVPALKDDYLKLSFSDPFNNIDDNDGGGYSFDIMK